MYQYLFLIPYQMIVHYLFSFLIQNKHSMLSLTPYQAYCCYGVTLGHSDWSLDSLRQYM